MRFTLKRPGEFIIQSLIYICGAASTVIVLLIIVFLFAEGRGLFSRPLLESGDAVCVHPGNLINKLSATQLRGIFGSKNLTDWQQVGGKKAPITPFTLDDLDDIPPDPADRQAVVLAYVLSNPNSIGILPNSYVDKTRLRFVRIDPLTISEYLFGTDWYPTSTPVPAFGILAILLATFVVTICSLLMAIPVGVTVGVYLAEIAGDRVRGMVKPIIELLAGIPSVVFGLFGLTFVVPLLKDIFSLPTGATALAGSIMLAIIALPTIITLTDDALRSVPLSFREASLSLGASHWQTIRRVLIPAALSGISSAVVLGVGRSIGETMAVLMVTGNSAQLPESIFVPVRTITANIALELGEAPQDGSHYQALFVLGCLLFLVTSFINILAELIASYQTR
jgi:phosphate transport system permease protein